MKLAKGKRYPHDSVGIRDCVDSRTVAAFGPSSPASSQSILSLRLEVCQSLALQERQYSLWPNIPSAIPIIQGISRLGSDVIGESVAS